MFYQKSLFPEIWNQNSNGKFDCIFRLKKDSENLFKFLDCVSLLKNFEYQLGGERGRAKCDVEFWKKNEITHFLS